MCKENSQPDDAEGKRQLICSGIWGGIRDLDKDVIAGPVLASLYSSSCDGGKGGDIYYFGVCKGGTLMRVAVADVVGHGEAVSDISQYMYDSLKARICDPDSSTILSELNQRVNHQGLKAMTTVAVVAYNAAKGEFHLSYAGHPPVLFRRANETTWSVASANNNEYKGDGPDTDLPLAVDPDATYHQQMIPATSGDRLFIYTDGVTEAPNNVGELFGTERLKGVLDTTASAPLSRVKSVLLRALHQHTDKGLTHDDVTLIALEVR